MTWNAKDLGKKNHERFIGGTVDWRSGQSDLQRIAVGAGELSLGCTRLNANGKANAAVELGYAQTLN